MTVNEDATQEAPAGAPAPTTDLGPAPEYGDLLAYSAGTSSVEVADYQPPRSLRPAWLAALVVALAAAVAAGTFVLGRSTGVSATAAQESPQPTTTPPLPVVAPKLNGAYEVFYDWKRTMHRDNRTDSGGTVYWENDGEPDRAWWAMRPICDATECVVIGTKLDDVDHRLPGTGGVVALRLVNGVWQDMTPARMPTTCTYRDTGAAHATATVKMSWTLTARPDGTVEGESIHEIVTNECGDMGDTASTPLRLTRIGDVPPGVLGK